MTTDANANEAMNTADAVLAQAAAKLSLIERRRIEAGVLIPLIRAFQAEFGVERANRCSPA